MNTISLRLSFIVSLLATGCAVEATPPQGSTGSASATHGHAPPADVATDSGKDKDKAKGNPDTASRANDDALYAGNCAALKDCCPQLPKEWSCETSAASSERSCERYLSSYIEQGYCKAK